MPGLFKVAMNISVWVVDRDLGVSRGYQYDDEDRIEDAEEVVKNDKDDNEEDNDHYQAIKCLDFLESQAQVELNDDDDKDEDEDVEVKDDNEEDNEDEDVDIIPIKSM